MDTHSILIAFGLTLFAGLSTGIGSAFAIFARRTNTRFLSSALGFSAGVMIYVSFIEIFPKGREALIESWGVQQGSWYAVAAFFAGILIAAGIDSLVPSFENPHEMHKIEEIDDEKKHAEFHRLYRVGIFSAVAIAVHNFPEGLATFAAALKEPALGVAIAIAIAIHNIPEGIAVAIPLYYATESKKKAFFYSFLSGLAEPVGALLGFFVLRTFFNDTLFGILFTGVAGIMVYISFDELLPSAEAYGEHHLTIFGLLSGMAVMALSLLFFI
jgi:ZIP family zinc transporter